MNIMCGGWVSALGFLLWVSGRAARPPQLQDQMSYVVSRCALWLSTLGSWAGSLTRPTQGPNIMFGGWVSTLGVPFSFLF